MTLVPLLELKSGGGHVAYEIARLLGLFGRDVYRHEGALTDKVVEGVASGVIWQLECRGTSAQLASQFDALATALASPCCTLEELRLVGCDWPEGRRVGELLEPLCSLGRRLRVLVIAGMATASGELLPIFFERCDRLEVFAACELGLTGEIPASVGRCVALRMLSLYGNKLEGPIPEAIGGCVAMQLLHLHNNNLSGEIPSSLGQCVAMQNLLLHNILLHGKVPALALANMSGLTQLALYGNSDELTITEAGKQAIMAAAPQAKFWWPRVV